MSQKIKKLFLLYALLAPLIVNALQLGKIVVTSSQGQPLNAEIEMMLTPGEDLSKLKTSLASKENYESQGIERLAIHNNISVELQKNEKGLTVLKLKSSQPVPDPFLDLLIQVDSAKGRNYREYTVLLDPPETPIIQQEKIVAVDKTDPLPINEKKEVKESTDKNKITFEKEIKNNLKTLEKNKPADPSSKSITVKPADTIYKIARENKIPSREPTTSATMHNGVFTRNTACQLKASTRKPPMVGPLAADTAPTAPQMPIAAERFSTGNSGNTNASDAGVRIAPPIACTTRAATSTSAVGANAHKMEPSIKMESPVRNARLRPNASASLPAVSNPAAYAML